MWAGRWWVCFPRGLTGPGDLGDRAWAAAVVMHGRSVVETHVVQGVAGAPYQPGPLALVSRLRVRLLDHSRPL